MSSFSLFPGRKTNDDGTTTQTSTSNTAHDGSRREHQQTTTPPSKHHRKRQRHNVHPHPHVVVAPPQQAGGGGGGGRTGSTPGNNDSASHLSSSSSSTNGELVTTVLFFVFTLTISILVGIAMAGLLSGSPGKSSSSSSAGGQGGGTNEKTLSSSGTSGEGNKRNDVTTGGGGGGGFLLASAEAWSPPTITPSLSSYISERVQKRLHTFLQLPPVSDDDDEDDEDYNDLGGGDDDDYPHHPPRRSTRSLRKKWKAKRKKKESSSRSSSFWVSHTSLMKGSSSSRSYGTVGSSWSSSSHDGSSSSLFPSSPTIVAYSTDKPPLPAVPSKFVEDELLDVAEDVVVKRIDAEEEEGGGDDDVVEEEWVQYHHDERMTSDDEGGGWTSGHYEPPNGSEEGGGRGGVRHAPLPLSSPHSTSTSALAEGIAKKEEEEGLPRRRRGGVARGVLDRATGGGQGKAIRRRRISLPRRKGRGKKQRRSSHLDDGDHRHHPEAGLLIVPSSSNIVCNQTDEASPVQEEGGVVERRQQKEKEEEEGDETYEETVQLSSSRYADTQPSSLVEVGGTMHFVLLVHGYRAYAEDLSYMKKSMVRTANRFGRRSPSPVMASGGRSGDGHEDGVVTAEQQREHQQQPQQPAKEYVVVHVARSNEGRTDDGIVNGGKRIVAELRETLSREIERIQRNTGIRIDTVTLSVVGNSLGGLYSRYALAELMRLDERRPAAGGDGSGGAGIRSKVATAEEGSAETTTATAGEAAMSPGKQRDGTAKTIATTATTTEPPLGCIGESDDGGDGGSIILDNRTIHFNVFCTTATPHLGIASHTYFPLPRTAEVTIAHAMKDTGKDLFRCNPLLHDMCTTDEYLRPLRCFRKRIAYANAFNTDFPVPTTTAAFLNEKSESLHRFVDHEQSGYCHDLVVAEVHTEKKEGVAPREGEGGRSSSSSKKEEEEVGEGVANGDAAVVKKRTKGSTKSSSRRLSSSPSSSTTMCATPSSSSATTWEETLTTAKKIKKRGANSNTSGFFSFRRSSREEEEGLAEEKEGCLISETAKVDGFTSNDEKEEDEEEDYDELAQMSKSLDGLGWKKVFFDLRDEIPLGVKVPTYLPFWSSSSSTTTASVCDTTTTTIVTTSGGKDDATGTAGAPANATPDESAADSSSTSGSPTMITNTVDNTNSSADPRHHLSQMAKQQTTIESKNLYNVVSTSGGKISWPMGHNMIVAFQRSKSPLSSAVHRKGRPVMDGLAQEMMEQVLLWDVDHPPLDENKKDRNDGRNYDGHAAVGVEMKPLDDRMHPSSTQHLPKEKDRWGKGGALPPSAWLDGSNGGGRPSVATASGGRRGEGTSSVGVTADGAQRGHVS